MLCDCGDEILPYTFFSEDLPICGACWIELIRFGNNIAFHERVRHEVWDAPSS
jgi:hypothetical protein